MHAAWILYCARTDQHTTIVELCAAANTRGSSIKTRSYHIATGASRVCDGVYDEGSLEASGRRAPRGPSRRLFGRALVLAPPAASLFAYTCTRYGRSSRGSSHARCAASFSEDDAVLDCNDDDHRNDAVLDRHDAVLDRNDAVLDRHDAEVAPPPSAASFFPDAGDAPTAGGGVARRAEAGEGAREEEAKAEGAQARPPPLLPNVRAREVAAPAREVWAKPRPRL